ncbi:MAG TPA: ABC transporter permease [Solirubrobacteraceae bacterium]|nr:ABC transporter permease [Solirubrobacteraceae bacterium]
MLSVYRAERRKLLAQLSTRVLALVCLLGPFAFAAVLSQQSGVPADTLLGVWVHSSGYALSFVVLGFAGYLGFPVLAGVLAGDLFSSEDRYGTWKAVLTRSCTLQDVFLGKLVAAGTFALGLGALTALSSLVAGLLFTGSQPLVGLGGTVIGSGECLALVLASWLLSMLPLLAFTSLAVLFSVAARNGIVGVLGPVLVAVVMQLLALIGSGAWVHALLLASAFDIWHGLLATPKFYGPLIIAAVVCVLWGGACAWASWRILRRRDFAGTPVAKRPGWSLPLRAVLGAAALIVLLGVAGNWGPTAVTRARLEASIAPAFNSLTLLQQRELGRSVPRGAKLDARTSCARRSGKSEGAGDDWSCTISTIAPKAGAYPLQLTPVVYDVSVKSDGCYKAQSPPSFVGQQTMSDARGRNVVNPLFTIYGCFDTTAAAHCQEGERCAPAPAVPSSNSNPRGSGGGAAATNARPSAAQRKVELEALRKAEHAAGPRVMREILESEKTVQREAEKPEGE